MSSNEPTRVEPGELITAEFMNGLLARIEQIESTLDDLEAPSKELTIEAIRPDRPVHVGDPLQVHGQDFAPLDETIVQVGNERVDDFDDGSNNARLFFDVPPIENLPGGGNGTKLSLTVSGKHGFDERSITVLPFEPTVPQGQIFLRLADGPDAATIEPGNTYIFTVGVEVISNMRETFDLTAGIDADSQPDAWSATPVDANGNSRSTVTFPRSSTGTTKDILVEVVVPSDTGGSTARLTFSVTSQQNPQNFAKTFESADIEVGAPPPESEAISIQLSDVQGGEVAADGKTVVVTDGALLSYSASVPENGVNYVVTLTNIPGGWEPQFRSGTSTVVSGTQGKVFFEVEVPDPGQDTPEGAFHIRTEKQNDPSVFGTFKQPLRRG